MISWRICIATPAPGRRVINTNVTKNRFVVMEAAWVDDEREINLRHNCTFRVCLVKSKNQKSLVIAGKRNKCFINSSR
jgi:hypothetical protein